MGGKLFYPWIAFQIVNKIFIVKSLGAKNIGTFEVSTTSRAQISYTQSKQIGIYVMNL